MRLAGLLAAIGKSAFFDIVIAMVSGLMFITLLLALLYLAYGREKKRS